MELVMGPAGTWQWHVPEKEKPRSVRTRLFQDFGNVNAMKRLTRLDSLEAA